MFVCGEWVIFEIESIWQLGVTSLLIGFNFHHVTFLDLEISVLNGFGLVRFSLHHFWSISTSVIRIFWWTLKCVFQMVWNFNYFQIVCCFALKFPTSLYRLKISLYFFCFTIRKLVSFCTKFSWLHNWINSMFQWLWSGQICIALKLHTLFYYKSVLTMFLHQEISISCPSFFD